MLEALYCMGPDMVKWCPDSINANLVGDGGHDFINMQVIPQQDPVRKIAVQDPFSTEGRTFSENLV